MRFQVPQFIEVESKIFGPLTWKQFVYLAGGAGIIFLLYVALPFPVMVFFAIPVGGFAAALAFYKINNQPFIKIVEHGLKYYMSPKIYLWRKEKAKVADLTISDVKRQREGVMQEEFIPKLTKSRLKDLSWSLDIRSKIK